MFNIDIYSRYEIKVKTNSGKLSVESDKIETDNYNEKFELEGGEFIDFLIKEMSNKDISEIRANASYIYISNFDPMTGENDEIFINYKTHKVGD